MSKNKDKANAGAAVADGNYVPIDDLPEHERDDLSSYSESERPGVSDAGGRTISSLAKTPPKLQGVGNFLKGAAVMYQNAGNDHEADAPPKSKTLGQEKLGTEMATSAQAKMHAT